MVGKLALNFFIFLIRRLSRLLNRQNFFIQARRLTRLRLDGFFRDIRLKFRKRRMSFTLPRKGCRRRLRRLRRLKNLKRFLLRRKNHFRRLNQRLYNL
jgi:hypothetical protein